MKTRRQFMGLTAGTAALVSAGYFDSGDPAMAQDVVQRELANRADPNACEGPYTVTGFKTYAPPPKEICELLTFWKRLRKEQTALLPAGVKGPYKHVTGISLPWATMPISMYMRCTGVETEIPEPQITMIHSAMLHQWNDYVACALNTIARAMHVLPPGMELVDHPEFETPSGTDEQVRSRHKVILCNRVVTPRYSTDIEQHGFSMRTTARMLVDAAEGLWREWQTRIRDSRDAIKKQKPGASVRLIFRATPMRCQCICDAYLFDFMAWNRGAGLAWGV